MLVSETDLEAQLARKKSLARSADMMEYHLANLQRSPLYACNDDGKIVTEQRLAEIRQEIANIDAAIEHLRFEMP